MSTAQAEQEAIEVSYAYINKPRSRKITAAESRDIRRLVLNMCANYDNHYKICAPKDRPCPILDRGCTTDKICTYFKNGVLPLNPALEARLMHKLIELSNQKSR